MKETSIPSGHCSNGTDPQTISVHWKSATQNQSNSFALTFCLNATTNEFALCEAVYQIFAGDLPNGNNDTLNFYHEAPIYPAPKQMSYHCNKVQAFNLTDSSNSTHIVGVASVSKVQWQAYHIGRDGSFSTASDCDAINTPGNQSISAKQKCPIFTSISILFSIRCISGTDIVPIAVGIALIALVVVVLIAYLVGRRRAQARGYVSM